MLHGYVSALQGDPSVSVVHQNLGVAVHKARDQAKELLTLLESQGHPQTGQSNSLYLALVTIQKRLFTIDPAPPPVASFVSELEQLVRACEGKLAPVKPLIEDALRMARGGGKAT